MIITYRKNTKKIAAIKESYKGELSKYSNEVKDKILFLSFDTAKYMHELANGNIFIPLFPSDLVQLEKINMYTYSIIASVEYWIRIIDLVPFFQKIEEKYFQVHNKSVFESGKIIKVNVSPKSNNQAA